MLSKPTNLTIYETELYENFKIYRTNRKITHNTELEKDILDCNKLKYHPIIINAQYKILDGQHRFEICKKNKLPVYFVFDLQGTEGEIMKVQNAKKWKQADYLRRYSKIGILSYVFIEEVMSRHSVSITAFLTAFGKKSKNVGRKFRSGEVEIIYREDFIKSILNKYEILKKSVMRITKNRIHREFEITLINILKNPDCNLEHLIDRIDKNPETVITALNCRTRVIIKNYIITAYNKNHRSDNTFIKLEQSKTD